MTSSDQLDLHEAFELCCADNNEKKTLINSLLESPWNCADDLLIRYVDPMLAQWILKLKKSVLYFIFNKSTHQKLFFFVSEINYYSIIKQQNYPTYLSKDNFFLDEKNIFIDLISEDLLKTTDTTWLLLDEHKQDLLINLYMCCSIAAYNVVGIINTPYHGNIFEIHHKYYTAFDIKNFRSQLNHLSNVADSMSIASPNLIFLIKKGKYLKNSDVLLNITKMITDKVFSIHYDFVQGSKKKEEIKKLIDRMQLLVFLCSFALMKAKEEKRTSTWIHDTTSISKYEIIKAGFTEAEINLLINTNKAPSSEQLIEKKENTDTYNIRYLNIKYAAQTHAKELQIPILYNNWFESNYLIPYLKKNLCSNRFVIGNGFTCKENFNIPHYDVDIVIYDNETNLFYFCQIKHRIKSMCIGLRGELFEYKGFITLGVNQLKNLKININHPKVKTQLKTAFQNTKINSKFIDSNNFTTNARFLFIHNVENFSFCTKEGISMYEWNTLRNLLQEQYSQVSISGYLPIQYEPNHIDFSDLAAIRNLLLDKVDMTKSMDVEQSVKYIHICNTHKVNFYGITIPLYHIKENIQIPVV